jgi:regulation of enolase protein 1 (concanavalin A-like superfamily)
MISLVPTVSAQNLSGGWTATNIGSPSLSGTTTFNGSVFSISAAGTDIAGTSDQFVFTYRSLTGDGDVVARVASLTNTHAAAKAGVMIRGALAANAAHVFAAVSAANGVVTQSRSTAGGSTTNTGGGSGAAPVWLKVERRGNTLRTYRSADGLAWTNIGSVTMTLPATVYVGLAATSHNSGARTTATASGVAVVPAGWSSIDVGAPRTTGDTWWQTDAGAVNASGSDIWGTNDQFRYVYRQYSGDVDVVTRVPSMTGNLAKGGLMIRGALTPSSANATVLAYAEQDDVIMQWRSANGGNTQYVRGATMSPGVWLKLEKRGSTINTYQSANGTSWTLVASRTLTLPSTFYVGAALVSREPSNVATFNYSNLSVSSPTAARPPTVSLTAPSSGSTFTAPATIAMSATAADTDGSVTRVDFRSGSTVVGSDTSSPYSFSWANVAAGTYTLTAVATDNSGQTTTSSPVTVTVNGTTSNQAPTVSLTSPANGSTFSLGALLTLTATASDPDGTIARVEFYAGSYRLGTDTTSPYSFTWINLPLGSFSLMAVAYDNAGAMTSSAQRAITVGQILSSRTAVFVPSPDHSTVASYLLEVFLQGVDPYTATPVVTQNLGKPAVVNGECAVDISQLVSSLPAGTYVATVSAVAGGGAAASAPSAPFSR